MPGRKPKPTHLKILEGNPGKQKLPKGEPVFETDLPEPPSFLDEYALEEWHRLAPGLHAQKLLTEYDVGSFAAYCSSFSRFRSAEEERQKLVEEEGPLAGLIQTSKNKVIAQNVLVNITRNAQLDTVKFAVEWGGTSSARARLAIDPGRKKKSKFDGLVGNAKK